MLKKSIGIGLLIVAGQTYSADITVTTTEDIVKDDEECSLREAIEYVNRGLAKEGYMGCGGENSSINILLPQKKTYELNKHLEIKASVNIKAIGEKDEDGFDLDNNRIPGLNNAHIKMLGKDNVFRILSDKDNAIVVNLSELDIEGCGSSQCADQGGLIYLKGNLTLTYSKLFKGNANQGGAIYSSGYFANSFYSYLKVTNSIFEQNKANQGGVLYSGLPVFEIGKSVFKQNETLNASSANIFSLAVPDVKPEDQSITSDIYSSTFLKNKGTVIDLIGGIAINNITVVDNTGIGVRVNSPTPAAFLANSIILGNTGSDCQISAENKATLQNNLVTASCGTGDAIYPNSIWSGTELFASKTGSEGTCLSMAENKTALLCPFSTPKDSFLGYLRPRILLSYNSLDESPIVNKGKSTLTGLDIVACEYDDQRSLARMSDNIYCDRGAIEIVVPTSPQLIGQDLKYGEVAKLTILEQLGDSDLIPKEQCNALVGPHPTGEAWQDGCMKVVQTKTESKGKTTIDSAGNIVYTPNSNWHGADIFEIQVITTSTRFNQSKPYIAVPVQIVQEPNNNFEDKTVKTSGGSWGFVGLFALLGLIGLRRVFKY